MKSERKERSRILALTSSLWRYSWVLTLPVAVFFLVWFFRTADTYYTFKVLFKPTMNITLLGAGRMHASDMLSELSAVFKGKMRPGSSGLPAVELFIQRK